MTFGEECSSARVEYRLITVSNIDGDKLNPRMFVQRKIIKMKSRIVIFTKRIEDINESVWFDDAISIEIMPTKEISP